MIIEQLMAGWLAGCGASFRCPAEVPLKWLQTAFTCLEGDESFVCAVVCCTLVGLLGTKESLCSGGHLERVGEKGAVFVRSTNS